MMWLATIRPGMKEPVVTQVPGEEFVFTAAGSAQLKPKKPYARKIHGGGASALSQSPEGAIASALCVMHQSDFERELLGKRDRS